MLLEQLGWNAHFQTRFSTLNNNNYTPARVIREEKGRYIVATEGGEYSAEICGKFRYKSTQLKDFPSVGDWVLIKALDNSKHGIIYHVLERQSCFTRKAPISGGRTVRIINNRKVILGGATEEQVVAANVDTVFIVMACDDNFNLRRLERYLLLTHNSGAKPIIVLNKIDLCETYSHLLHEIEGIAKGVEIHPISALAHQNIESLNAYISEGTTIGLFGSSGVGKSTIINRLLGNDLLATSHVRESDSKGRHTTTWRELVILPTGGVLIDTPGMRELQLWINDADLEFQFADIESLKTECKYNDCSHRTEPGCAVQESLENGSLSFERYENYLLLQSETRYLTHRRHQKEETCLVKIKKSVSKY